MSIKDKMAVRMGEGDKAEAMLRNIDETATARTGISFFHILTIVSIVGSVALFLSGRKIEGLFVGLWPPTFQALKSAAENSWR
jgi:hypothetical protein